MLPLLSYQLIYNMYFCCGSHPNHWNLNMYRKLLQNKINWQVIAKAKLGKGHILDLHSRWSTGVINKGCTPKYVSMHQAFGTDRSNSRQVKIGYTFPAVVLCAVVYLVAFETNISISSDCCFYDIWLHICYAGQHQFYFNISVHSINFCRPSIIALLSNICICIWPIAQVGFTSSRNVQRKNSLHGWWQWWL